MNEGGGRNQGITMLHRIRHMEPRTLPCHRNINGKNPIGKGRQHIGLKPLPKQGALCRIPSLHKKYAGFNFKNGDGGEIETLNLHTCGP